MDQRSQRLFRRLDRAFWLIWLGFPVLIWTVAAEVRGGAARLEGLSAEQLACLETLPQVHRFGPLGQAAFWGLFALEYAVYAGLLALAHQVIRRCAAGRALVAEMIRSLRLIGTVIAVWPVAQLALANGVMLIWARTGDMPGFVPSFALDLVVVGVGLMLLTLAAAMRQAVALREDADLTI
jgi:hypothetical protein